MGFAQANSLQEAMTIALNYTQSQMTEKNVKKTIRNNLYYIPSVRTGYIANEESRTRKADVLAETADRYWLEALFTFHFLYWEEHKLLGIVMMSPESVNEKWPLSMYFQNSCDQDYPFFEWKEGNIPFFANAAAKAENYTAEEIRAKVDYEIEDDDLELEYFMRLGLLSSASVVKIICNSTNDLLEKQMNEIILKQIQALHEEKLLKYS